MFNKDISTGHPFWIDDPNPYSPPDAGWGPLFNPISRFNTGFSFAWQVIFLILAIALAFQYPWIWLLVAYLSVAGLLKFRLIRQRLQTINQSAEIQRLAKEKTGASIIGSAIHTAGHPLLQINQPVVLALIDESLSIYNYQNAIPLDTILLKDIQLLELVSYDDDGIPHTGVINSIAQALQLHCLIRGRIYTCLFRRMYKVKAVGWYQAIQTAQVALPV